jgi:hypothetical protein
MEYNKLFKETGKVVQANKTAERVLIKQQEKDRAKKHKIRVQMVKELVPHVHRVLQSLAHETKGRLEKISISTNNKENARWRLDLKPGTLHGPLIEIDTCPQWTTYNNDSNNCELYLALDGIWIKLPDNVQPSDEMKPWDLVSMIFHGPIPLSFESGPYPDGYFLALNDFSEERLGEILYNYVKKINHKPQIL